MDEGPPFICSGFLMETFYHQIAYDSCLGIKHSPAELVLFRPGRKVQVGYSVNFMEMEEAGKDIFDLIHTLSCMGQ